VIAARSHDDDRNVPGGRIALEFGGDLVAAHAGHHHVEKHQIWRVARYVGKRLLPIARGADVVSVGLEHRLQELDVLELVIDNQNFRGWSDDLRSRDHRGSS
jgi:hypothetical protein